MNKNLSFAKNVALAVVAGGAAAAGVAELSDLVTSSNAVTGGASTAAEYAAGMSTFLWFHARDNHDIYGGNPLRSRHFWRDQARFGGGLAALDVAYLTGRTWLAKQLMDNGQEPATASVLADAVAVSAYAVLAYPVARLTGIIRSSPSVLPRGLREK